MARNKNKNPAAVGFGDVLTKERVATDLGQDGPMAGVAAMAGASSPGSRDALQSAIAAGSSGLALSGGGIRSATFSLGVLQALAMHKRLKTFDYLSTVSGGGYIGSWLSAWIKRQGLDTVEEQLGQCGSMPGALPASAEAAPVTWLRKYSNYLAPRVGLLSLDALTLMSIWLRNVLLNLVIVVAFISVLLLLPKLLIAGVPRLLPLWWPAWVAVGFGLLLLPMMICVNLMNVVSKIKTIGTWLVKPGGVTVTVIVPGTIAAITGSLALFGSSSSAESWHHRAATAAVCLGVVSSFWLMLQVACRKPAVVGIPADSSAGYLKDAWAFALAAIGAAALIFTLIYLESHLFVFTGQEDTGEYVKLLVFGPPAFLVTFGLGGFAFVGLAGNAYREASREWWSRLNALFFLIGTVWFLYMGTSLYSPALARWALASSSTWAHTLAGLGWLGSLLTALVGPRFKHLSNTAEASLLAVLNLAAYVVIVGVVVAIALLSEVALDHWAAVETLRVSGTEPLSAFIARAAAHLKVVENANFYGDSLLVVAFCASLFVLLLFGWRVDVNKFSLHNMYKNRLIRAYLGASRQRLPQPFDGFDTGDDIALTELAAQRPYHILNTTLNISQGENLAWQERKAASFVLSPSYCGFAMAKSQGDSSEKSVRPGAVGASATVDPGMPHYESIPGYQRTEDFGAGDEDHALTLGTAMAVSGAAVSPTMGALTRPALAFVLTLFNARLGRWTANPSQDKWRSNGPRFGLVCFLQELFGWSNERRNYVYLSDGGHFDNLGLYELVRRRCKTIWVVDASGDPRRACEDLGRSIRQCRVDFGVEITIPLINLAAAPPALFPKAGFAAGTIHYGPHLTGKIIYLKPTLCLGEKEPDDVLSYAKKEPTFPHQTTADQFFDESQFESYRRLGMHIAEGCIGAGH